MSLNLVDSVVVACQLEGLSTFIHTLLPVHWQKLVCILSCQYELLRNLIVQDAARSFGYVFATLLIHILGL